MFEDWDIWLMVVGGSLVAVSLFFYGGRLYERREWRQEIPVAMNEECKECESIGVMEGYKKGLQTCDDIVDKANLDGRY